MNIILLLILSIFTTNCKDKNDGNDGNQGGEAPCNPNLRPIVFVHGALASGDTYELQAQRFSSNSYCTDRIFAFDWNSINFGGGDPTAELDAFIDQVLAETGAEKIDLAGHSAGSNTGYNYLSTAEQAAKVAHYVHLAGNPTDGPAGPEGEIPTLNIWSTEDLVVAGGEIPGATNEMQTDKDHYEVATSQASFEKMYAFFNDGEAPSTTEIVAQEDIVVAGRVVTFGENTPIADATVNIYEVVSTTGYRSTETAIATTTSTADGSYGNVTLRPDTYYEFVVNPNDGSRTVHYFREPFSRSSDLVYLRTIPSGGIGALLLGSLPEDNDQTVLSFYSGSRAVINGRDMLSVDGNILSTSEFASAENSTIAMFYYDGNDNGSSDLSDIGGTWGLVPAFLAAVDMYIPTTPTTSIELELNGRKITVPNLKSGTDGVIVAQFY